MELNESGVLLSIGHITQSLTDIAATQLTKFDKVIEHSYDWLRSLKSQYEQRGINEVELDAPIKSLDFRALRNRYAKLSTLAQTNLNVQFIENDLVSSEHPNAPTCPTKFEMQINNVLSSTKNNHASNAVAKTRQIVSSTNSKILTKNLTTKKKLSLVRTQVPDGKKHVFGAKVRKSVHMRSICNSKAKPQGCKATINNTLYNPSVITSRLRYGKAAATVNGKPNCKPQIRRIRDTVTSKIDDKKLFDKLNRRNCIENSKLDNNNNVISEINDNNNHSEINDDNNHSEINDNNNIVDEIDNNNEINNNNHKINDTNNKIDNYNDKINDTNNKIDNYNNEINDNNNNEINDNNINDNYINNYNDKANSHNNNNDIDNGGNMESNKYDDNVNILFGNKEMNGTENDDINFGNVKVDGANDDIGGSLLVDYLNSNSRITRKMSDCSKLNNAKFDDKFEMNRIWRLDADATKDEVCQKAAESVTEDLKRPIVSKYDILKSNNQIGTTQVTEKGDWKTLFSVFESKTPSKLDGKRSADMALDSPLWVPSKTTKQPAEHSPNMLKYTMRSPMSPVFSSFKWKQSASKEQIVPKVTACISSPVNTNINTFKTPSSNKRFKKHDFYESPEFQCFIDFNSDSEDHADTGPCWTKKENLYPALLAQTKMNSDEIFCNFKKSCDLSKIFNSKHYDTKKFRPRTSSADWSND